MGVQSGRSWAPQAMLLRSFRERTSSKANIRSILAELLKDVEQWDLLMRGSPTFRFHTVKDRRLRPGGHARRYYWQSSWCGKTSAQYNWAAGEGAKC